MKDNEDSRFSMDVEVVSQALRQRSGKSSVREEGQNLFRKFSTTKQEPVRLAVALRAFFLEDGVTEEEKSAYAAYLQKRFRPAVRQLIEEDAVENLERMRELGWFEKQSPRQMEDFLETASQRKKISAMVWLLHLKEELYGHPDRDFSL